MAITVRKVGRKNEYTETIRHSCGHEIDITTLGYKMERRQVKAKKRSPCLSCQLKSVLVS